MAADPVGQQTHDVGRGGTEQRAVEKTVGTKVLFTPTNVMR